MSSYFSLAFFLVFLPLTLLAYSIVPKRARWIAMLAASYLFYAFLSGALIVFVIVSTISVYICGLKMAALIGKRDALLADAKSGRREIKADCKRRMRYVLALGIVFNVFVLVMLKYLKFFCKVLSLSLLQPVADTLSVVSSIGVPMGISFYTLMAISYLIDVYRGTVCADRHLGRVALFLVFFPQIMEGPICRYSQTASALTSGEPIKRSNLYEGSVRILYGLAKKIVIADRLNAFVKLAFNDYANYDGGVIAAAAVLYTVQLYCDFSGTMDVAIGIGRIFGVNLPENFRRPFFSRTASEFWMRWHITLGTWFKDYVYYPISLSRPCKRLTATARKRVGNRYGPLLVSSMALFCVWVGNGLWHGAGSQYLFFGMYYFVAILAGGFVEPIAQAATARLGINRDGIPYRSMQIARTLIIVFIGELFFRANGLKAGLDMFSRMVSGFTLDSLMSGALPAMGLGYHDIAIIAVMLLAMLFVEIAQERGCSICATIAARNVLIRWGVLIGLLVIIVVFGAYGVGYAPVDPMYAQF